MRRYEYRAGNFSVVDGDTVRCDIDLGFGVWLRDQILRLHGINAPEIRGGERPEGLASKEWCTMNKSGGFLRR